VWALSRQALARSDQPPSLTAVPGFAGCFRPGHFLPLNVTIRTTQRSVIGQLIVSSDTIVIRKRVELPAPSVRTFNFLLAPQLLRPVVEVRLLSEGKIAAQTQLRSLRAVPASALLVSLVGNAPARFTPLVNKLPQGSQLSHAAAKELPTVFRGYEALDLLIIGDLSSELTNPQREAVTTWLRGGGSMLVIMPAGGIGSAGAFWQRFLPDEVVNIALNLRGADRATAMRSSKLSVFADEKHPGLVGFNIGLGRVLLSTHGQGHIIAAQKAREDIAQAILHLLALDTPPRRSSDPLPAADVYELFEKPGWPRRVRTTIWISVLGYALAMAVTLKVFARERPIVFAAFTVAFAAAFTAGMYFAVLPGPRLTVQSVGIARARPGASALAVTHYLHLASPTDTDLSVTFAAPTKPLFFSDTMLAHGPVDIRQTADGWRYDMPPGAGKPFCFEQSRVSTFSGSIAIHVTDSRYEITNSAADLATGAPITLTDVILTDGADAILIRELSHGKTISVDLAPGEAIPIERLIWDTFAARRQCRYRLLRRWVAGHRPGSGTWLLGWSARRPEPPVRGRLLSREHKGTLWEIEVK